MLLNRKRILLLSTLTLLPAAALMAKDVPHASAITNPIKVAPFQPPDESKMPEGEFGDMVRLGQKVFSDTGRHAAKFVGNGLACANCHLDAGRLANSAPLWAAWVSYPAYRGKNKMVNTMEQRIQGCFRYSMNGTPPPADSDEMKGIMSYAYWLASGAPTNKDLPGRGYPDIAKPDKKPDFDRGKQVFQQNCALCHGENGHGTKVSGHYVFPPLWGKDSFNWGAGMHRINTAAQFIRANMPLGRGGMLSVQDAWDVAYFINSHERPQDPRYNGNLAQTNKKYHDHQCRYDEKQGGHVLGMK